MHDPSPHKHLKRRRQWPWLLIPILLALIVGLEGATGMAQGPGNGPPTVMTVSAARIEWQPHIDHAGMTLSVSGADGITFRQEFAPGRVATFELVGPEGQRYPDGTYTYELRAAPVLDEETRAALAAARESGDSDAVVAQLRQASKLPPQRALVQSGYFAIRDGEIVLGNAPEPRSTVPSVWLQDDDSSVPPQPDAGSVGPLDQVIADDLIVNGSLCVGNDCYDEYPFGFDTVVLRENNLRFFFDDTSATSAYARNDWRIILNDSQDGGGDYFALEDATGTSNILVIEAGAPANSLYVNDWGNVGINTSNPGTSELHIVDGDSPTVRLEQDWTIGWTPQTWDVAGNEEGFFIRDSTHDNQRPFRIEPNAPDDTLFIDSNGNVGIGTGSPSEKLHLASGGIKFPDGSVQESAAGAGLWSSSGSDIYRSTGDVGIGTTSPAYPLEVERTGTDATLVVERTDGAAAKFSAGGNQVQFGSMTDHNLAWVVNSLPVATLDAGGNLTLDGALTELSDANAKENWASIDGQDVLARLAEVPITTWNYCADDDEVRHMGPMAQDFYAAFGLGLDERHIAPLDTNGVALASVQELYRLVQEQDGQIARLEQTNTDLEARVAALEALVQALLSETAEE